MPLLAVRGNGPASAYGFGASSGKESAITAIASNTLGSDSASVTFSSIPSTYTDLMVVCYIKSNGSDFEAARFRFNSTTSGYSNTFLYAVDATAGSYASPNTSLLQNYASSRGVSAQTLHVFNYANTSYWKTCLIRGAQNDNGVDYVSLDSGLWESTSAISSITMVAMTSFRTGTVFALYGIKKAA